MGFIVINNKDGSKRVIHTSQLCNDMPKTKSKKENYTVTKTKNKANKPKPTKLPTDEKWLREKADIEDKSFTSVGGLVQTISKAKADEFVKNARGPKVEEAYDYSVVSVEGQTSVVKEPKPGYVICPDCNGEYKEGLPHVMFCEAHTCEECGTSYRNVVEKVDGHRVCEKCLERAEE